MARTSASVTEHSIKSHAYANTTVCMLQSSARPRRRRRHRGSRRRAILYHTLSLQPRRPVQHRTQPPPWRRAMVRADEHAPVVRHPDRSRTAVLLSLRPGKGCSIAARGRRMAEGAGGSLLHPETPSHRAKRERRRIGKSSSRTNFYDDFGETTSETDSGHFCPSAT